MDFENLFDVRIRDTQQRESLEKLCSLSFMKNNNMVTAQSTFIS
jgi:hypothetical protein